jgi:hypothetical protein
MPMPSKNPLPLEPAPAASRELTPSPHELEQPLTEADCQFVLTLDPRVQGDERVRSDMLQLLTEPETVAALNKYGPVLTTLGIDPAPAVATTAHIRKLQRARRRLELTQSLVTRHLQASGAPAMEIVSKLHRVIEGTPENSPMRVAFSLFLEQWQSTFRGGRPAKSTEARAEKSDEAAATKTPPTK